MIGIKKRSALLFIVSSFVFLRVDAQLYNDPFTLNRSLDLQTASYYPTALQSFLFQRNSIFPPEFLETIDFNIVLNTLRVNDVGSEKLLGKFLMEYPTTDAIQSIPYEIANYYFDQGKYRYALKWFVKVNDNQVPLMNRNQFYFNKGYTLFSAKRYKAAQPLFEKVKSIPEYESNAYYYLGHIAYQLEDYTQAIEQFDRVSEEKQKEDLAYFQVDMNFRLGRFEEAIALGKELGNKGLSAELNSEVSKIVGESYFNLEQYAAALPYLSQYEGKKGKWKNIDFYQLGFAYYKTKDYEEAIGQFNKIIAKQSALAQSAYYYLGDAYLKTDQKAAALNAFRSAAAMEYDNTIKEDALLQYAKLSYEIGNPYEDTSAVIIAFLERYPESEEKQILAELLIDSFTSSGNYDAALDILMNNKTYKNPAALQKISYLKAIKTYQSGNYKGAIAFFEQAVKVDERPQFTAAARYWLGRTLYELNRFDDALDTYKNFKKDQASKAIAAGFRIDYDMAYTYFKLGEYAYSLRFFESFLALATPQISSYRYDVQLRMGDCQFALKKYWPAMEHYNKALALKPQEAAYASYQKAISYGFVDRNDKKIESLKELVSQFPSSGLTDDAWFQLGVAHTAAANYTAAIEAYKTLERQFPKSLYVPKAILNQGLILYNQAQNNPAKEVLKRLVKSYPKDVVALQAVNTLKEIAIDLGEVNAFTLWLRENKINNLSDAELERTAFAAAEKRFIENDKKQAAKLLEEYLTRYPSGANQLAAQFYWAEIFYEEENYAQAIAPYEQLVANAPNEYHEKALVRLISIAQQMETLSSNVALLEKLLALATFEENKQFAQLNLMQVYYAQEAYEKAKQMAQEILGKKDLDQRLRWDALTIEARSAKMLGDTPTSSASYAQLETHPEGLIAAEALYFRALKEHEQGTLEKSNETIIKIASTQKGGVWNAKALLLLAENFYLLEDSFQANYILETLIETYPEQEEIIAHAKTLLEKVQNELTKNNASLDVEE